MLSKSAAAANLCTWVVNIYRFNRIYVKVKPLMDTLEAARASKAAADASLNAAMSCVAAVERKLQALQEKFVEATEEKAKVEREAAACLERLGLAERLVGGLSSENERWGNEIKKLQENAQTLVGDCMLAAGFVSYVGAFDQDNRTELWKGVWTPDLVQRGIPLTAGVDPLDMLSIENGSIITNCKRWPLIIDPQTQGIKWLRSKEAGNGLQVLQLTQKNYTKKIERVRTHRATPSPCFDPLNKPMNECCVSVKPS
jgi:dynein heavy chain, axonemal